MMLGNTGRRQFWRALRNHRAQLLTEGLARLPEAKAKARAWVRQQLNACRDKKRVIQQEYVRVARSWGFDVSETDSPRPRYYHHRGAIVARVGGFFILLMEMIFASWFAVEMYGFPRVVAALVGIIYTAGLGYFAYAAINGMFVSRHSDAPRAALVSLISLLLVAVPLDFLLVFGVFYARSAGTEFGDSLFIYSSAALSVLLPVTAGVCLNVRDLLRWSTDYATDWEEMVAREHALEELGESCGTASTNAEPTSSAGPGGSSGPVPPAIAAAVVATLLVGVAASVSAQVVMPTDLYIDDSSNSMDAAQLREVHRIVVGEVAGLQAIRPASAWQFFRFADRPWTAVPVGHVALPIYVEPKCPAPQYTKASKLLKKSRERAEREAKETCDAAQVEALRRFRDGMIDASAKIESELRKSSAQAVAGANVCTNLNDQLQRLAMLPKPTTVVLATDGYDTCTGRLTAVPQPIADVRVVVVLIEPKERQGREGVAFGARRAALLEAAPWLYAVVPPWAFTANLIVRPAVAMQLVSTK